MSKSKKQPTVWTVGSGGWLYPQSRHQSLRAAKKAAKKLAVKLVGFVVAVSNTQSSNTVVVQYSTTLGGVVRQHKGVSR